MNTRALGTRYENLAAEQLRLRGYRILCRNYRCKKGEIDLIAEDHGTLVFIEVKFRRSDAKGSAAEAVNRKKQRRIMQVAAWYLMEMHLAMDTPCRFDVVAIDADQVQVITDAFWS